MPGPDDGGDARARRYHVPGTKMAKLADQSPSNGPYGATTPRASFDICGADFRIA